MNRRTKFIIWIAAVILFALAFVLDVSTFNYWRDIEIKMVLFMLALILSGGLLLSLFLFRKKKYPERISFTIPIAIFIFSTLTFFKIINYEYGLFDKYNYFSAKHDIEKGKVQLIDKGLIMPAENSEKEEAIRNQFGYKAVWDGCTIENNGYIRYNAVMEDYLSKINGENWKTRLQQKIDSVRNAQKTE